MRHFQLLFAFLLTLSAAVAQTSNAVLFTENGEKFTVIINGVRQNEEPATNVKITGLKAEFYKLKVIFSNPASGERNFNLYVNTGTETSYSIKKNAKGEYVIRLVSEVPLAQAADAVPSQAVVAHNINPAAFPIEGTVTRTTAAESTTTQFTSVTENGNNDKKPHVSGDGGNITISDAGINGDEEKARTTIVHTTTTTTHTITSHPAPSQPASYLPGYTGPVGCMMPMTDIDFSELKSAVAAKTFEDARMTVARQVLSDRCILSSQVKELMQLFSFEENRLEFAKYAYEKTYDIGNYLKVSEAFKFENSTEELTKYINAH